MAFQRRNKMKQIISMAILILFITTISVHAQPIDPNDAIYKAGKRYVRQLPEDVFRGSFNMCDCMKNMKKEHDVEKEELRKICWEAVKAFLFKKSEKSQQIETATIVGCTE